MAEQSNNKIIVANKNVSADIFRTMLRWLYVGECEISHDPKKVLPLLHLTDEYLLPDL